MRPPMENKAPTQAEIRAALEALKIHENGRHATMLPDNAAQTIRYCLAAMADCVSYAELEAGIKILKDAYNADPEIRFYNKPIETIIKAARQHLRVQCRIDRVSTQIVIHAVERKFAMFADIASAGGQCQRVGQMQVALQIGGIVEAAGIADLIERCGRQGGVR